MHQPKGHPSGKKQSLQLLLLLLLLGCFHPCLTLLQLYLCLVCSLGNKPHPKPPKPLRPNLLLLGLCPPLTIRPRVPKW